MKTQHALIGLGLVLTTACNSGIKTFDTIDAPDETAVAHDWTDLLVQTKTSAETFRVSSTEPTFITTKSGSKITVPANCFVDAHGNAIDGKIDLHWEEFHTLADQLLSDINMMYDSAGVSFPFISGGMFKIDGQFQGESVFFASDKSIRIDLLSQSEREDFNFYKQAANSTEWVYKMNTKNELKPVNYEAPQESPKSATEFASNPRAGYVLDAKPSNLSDFHEFDSVDVLGWVATKELTSKERFTLNNETSKSTLIAVGAKKYELLLEFKSEQMNFSVKPYTLEDATRETAQLAAEFEAEKKRALENRAKREAMRVVRTMEINDFATYNWNVCGRMSQPKTFYANFVSTSNIDIDGSFRCALVCISDQYQVKFNPNANSPRSFDSAQRNAIIAIDADGRLYYVSPDTFKTFGQAGMKPQDVMELVDAGVKIQSKNDLDDLINHLKSV